MTKKLIELDENESGIIHSFDEKSLSSVYINDLLDYGFLPGSQIRLIYKSISQNKILVTVGSSEIALRIKDANFIDVVVTP